MAFTTTKLTPNIFGFVSTSSYDELEANGSFSGLQRPVAEGGGGGDVEDDDDSDDENREDLFDPDVDPAGSEVDARDCLDRAIADGDNSAGKINVGAPKHDPAIDGGRTLWAMQY